MTASKELGVVRKVAVGPEDHGIFTVGIHLDFGGAGQMFGGYSLDEYDKALRRRVGTAAGMDMLVQLTAFFGVSDLHQAVGKYVYAVRENDSWGAAIIALERTKPEGGAVFSIHEWRAYWYGGAL